MNFEITRLAKRGGPLTKRISLGMDGSLCSDGSACVMSEGEARRVELSSMDQLAALIETLAPNEALALGALRADLPDRVTIATKEKLARMNGAARPDIVARTRSEIVYREKRPAPVLIDFDRKGMPPEIAARIDAAGGFWSALVGVMPMLSQAARVTRASTSAGLYRADTGEKFAGSGGVHCYVTIEDGVDAERFLATLHSRCWLAGLGWMMVGAGGQLLDRSIVDRMVGASERLVFEGAPVLDPPLAQDATARHPVAMAGSAIDTALLCPPLTILETSRLKEMRARETERLCDDAARARAEFVAMRARQIVERTGMAPERARQIVMRQCAGILLPDEVLFMDDFSIVTVADVLADPARFDGATLADPLEGVEYGRNKAKIMRRGDGTPWIHSFAHGRTVYELRYDAAAIERVLEGAGKDAADIFVRYALVADLSEQDLERLRDKAAATAGVGKRALNRELKFKEKDRDRKRREEDHEHALAARRDPRPRVKAPMPAAPWLPVMATLNEALAASRDPEPPTRDIDGALVAVRVRRASNLHTLTARDANEETAPESRLPPPEQPLLTRLDEIAAAELIERHVEHETGGVPVHLGPPFVRHFLVRQDGALPTAHAVATLPLVLPDGTLLAGRGLDRERGIVFRVPAELSAMMPKPGKCREAAVAEAMTVLCDVWLANVETSYAGKCVIIAAACSVIERHLLPERPAFEVEAGQRGSGKTTTVNMIATAATGERAAAAAWSPSDEERRKALFAYLSEGVPLLCWDNIERGATISCPAIEKALTAATVSDRVLGVSQTRTVPATTIQIFTGNNISPRGDLASRTLTVRLAVDRPDPENREFSHPDPIGWTEANRGKILTALYTILLGNPRLGQERPEPPQTRFKLWWHLIGSAIEHAAACCIKARADWPPDDGAVKPTTISFKSMFATGEAEDVQAGSLATLLVMFRKRKEWSNGFTAGEIVKLGNQSASDGERQLHDDLIEAIAQASGRPFKGAASGQQVTARLKAIKDAPVPVADGTMVLRYTAGHDGGVFRVELAKAAGTSGTSGTF